MSSSLNPFCNFKVFMHVALSSLFSFEEYSNPKLLCKLIISYFLAWGKLSTSPWCIAESRISHSNTISWVHTAHGSIRTTQIQYISSPELTGGMITAALHI